MANSTIEAVLKISAKMGNLKALSTLQNELSRVNKQVDAVNRAGRFGGVQRQMAALNRQMMPLYSEMLRIVAPAALTYGAVQAVRSYADVERQLTRTGLTLGATREDMASLYGDIQKTARAYALPSQEVMDIANAYAAAGADLGEIRSDVDILAKASQAIGAGGQDIVTTWDAARKSLNLTTADAQRFFELVAAGSQAGKFEGADMAQFLPTVLPVAARQGFTGIEGANKIVGFLEVMLDYVGEPSEAATSLSDFLEKLSSPDVERNLAKFGIDWPKRMKEAKEGGEDLFEVVHDLLQEVTKGDAAQLGKIFGDKEARRAADVILRYIGRIREAQDTISRNAPQILDRNNAELLKDTAADLQRINEIMDQLGQGGGHLLVEAGVVDWFADKADYLFQAGEDIKRAKAAYGAGMTVENLDAFQEAFRSALSDGKSIAEAFEQAVKVSSDVVDDFASRNGNVSEAALRQRNEQYRLFGAGKVGGRGFVDGEVLPHRPGWENADPYNLPEKGPINRLKDESKLKIGVEESLPRLPAEPVKRFGELMPISGPDLVFRDEALALSEFDRELARQQVVSDQRDDFRPQKLRPLGESDDYWKSHPIWTALPGTMEEHVDRSIAAYENQDGAQGFSDQLAGLESVLSGLGTIGDDIEQSGQAAGQAFADAGTQAGQAVQEGGATAADAMRTAIIAGGRAAGEQLAQALRVAVASIPRTISVNTVGGGRGGAGGGGLPPASGNMGQSMPNAGSARF